MRSRLLFNEKPLFVLPTLAVKIGVNESMMVQQIHYWLDSDLNQNFDGKRYWVYNTYSQWGKQFPFWGEKTIRRTIASLENQGILISQVKTVRFKKTKFYTLNYERLEELEKEVMSQKVQKTPSGQNDQTDLPKRADVETLGAKDDLDQTCSEGLLEDENDLSPLAKNISQEPLFSTSGQNDQTDLPIWSDRSGQNDQIDLVTLTRSYKDTETTEHKNTLPPPLTPPPSVTLVEEEDEEEEIPNFAKIKISGFPSQGFSLSSKTVEEEEDEEEEEEEFIKNADKPKKLSPQSLEEQARSMLGVWNTLIQPKLNKRPALMTARRQQRLLSLLDSLLGSDPSQWIVFCKKLQECSFLMERRESGFQVTLDWVLDPDNAVKVWEEFFYNKLSEGRKDAPQISAAEVLQKQTQSRDKSPHNQEWEAFCQKLLESMEPATFESWISGLSLGEISKEAVELLAPTRFVRDYVTTHFYHELRRAIESIFPGSETLTIIHDPSRKPQSKGESHDF